MRTHSVVDLGLHRAKRIAGVESPGQRQEAGCSTFSLCHRSLKGSCKPRTSVAQFQRNHIAQNQEKIEIHCQIKNCLLSLWAGRSPSLCAVHGDGFQIEKMRTPQTLPLVHPRKGRSILNKIELCSIENSCLEALHQS